MQAQVEKMNKQMAEHTITQAGNTSSNLYQHNMSSLNILDYKFTHCNRTFLHTNTALIKERRGQSQTE